MDARKLATRDANGKFVKGWNKVSDEDRFWSKVDKRGPDECWEWQAGKTQGYGLIKYGGGNAKVRAHRLSYELLVGPIPGGLCVCHHCDNRACVNPKHLFVGTRDDNNKDAAKKGRMKGPPNLKGENHPMSKLTWDEVKSIRTLYWMGVKDKRELADTYGVHHKTIVRIAEGKSWKY